ncbi:hypothetical protein ABK040_001816 [Willaertia magna]
MQNGSDKITQKEGKDSSIQSNNGQTSNINQFRQMNTDDFIDFFLRKAFSSEEDQLNESNNLNSNVNNSCRVVIREGKEQIEFRPTSPCSINDSSYYNNSYSSHLVNNNDGFGQPQEKVKNQTSNSAFNSLQQK